MHHKSIFLVASAVALITGFASASCSESTDGVVPGAALTTEAGKEAGEDGAAVVPPDSSSGGGDSAVVTSSALLINEISASAEWIELVSSGTGALDVSGYKIADLAKDGGPKLDEAVTFPAGTILSPNAYLIVQAGGLDGGGKDCPEGAQSYCFKGEFGISNKNGDTIHLLDTTGKVVGTAIYPPYGADAGETWGRVPSGDPAGKFQKTTPTPGAKNKAN